MVKDLDQVFLFELYNTVEKTIDGFMLYNLFKNKEDLFLHPFKPDFREEYTANLIPKIDDVVKTLQKSNISIILTYEPCPETVYSHPIVRMSSKDPSIYMGLHRVASPYFEQLEERDVFLIDLEKSDTKRARYLDKHLQSLWEYESI